MNHFDVTLCNMNVKSNTLFKYVYLYTLPWPFNIKSHKCSFLGWSGKNFHLDIDVTFKWALLTLNMLNVLNMIYIHTDKDKVLENLDRWVDPVL